MRRGDLRKEEVPLSPQQAWNVIGRLLVNPVRIHELTSLGEAVSGTGVRSDSSLRSTAIQRAVLSGELVLLMQSTNPTGQAPAQTESVADQLLNAREVKTWVEMEVIDMLGKAVPGKKYICSLPDGSINEGKLDANGRVRFDGIIPGTCSFSLTELDRDAWERVI